VGRALKSEYADVDFELVLHTLEQLQSFADARWNPDMLDNFRPVLVTFADIFDRYKFLLSPGLLVEARKAVILAIADSIIARTINCGGSARGAQQLGQLVQALEPRFSLSAFTLNYDELIDQALSSWFDGFESPSALQGTAQAFNATKFVNGIHSAPNVLIHLHGSVRFGYSRGVFGLVKHDTATEAYDSIENVGVSDQVASQQIVSLSPIISGLNKIAKLLQNPSPFGYYYRAFVDSMLITPRLLIVGY